MEQGPDIMMYPGCKNEFNFFTLSWQILTRFQSIKAKLGPILSGRENLGLSDISLFSS